MAKKNWEKFEEECLDYLIQNFGNLASFTLKGGMKSNESDIQATLPNGTKFYIEVKENEAQCSQFVVLPDFANRIFEYSTHNKLKMNPFTTRIIEYMNHNFDKFCNPGTKGVMLDPNLAACAGHIRYQHMVKDVEFFMTKGKDFIIFPLSFFKFYFDIETVYRTKKSGSAKVPKCDETQLNDHLLRTYGFKATRNKDNQFVVPINKKLLNKRIVLGKSEYIFSEGKKQEMVLRKLSNTRNANVIFVLKLKKDAEGMSIDDIKKFLTMFGRN